MQAQSSAEQGNQLKGKAVFVGPAQRVRAIRMSADPNCESLHSGRVMANDKLIAEDGGLANVFVYLETAPGNSFDPATPEESVTLTQQGCLYVPRVQGIRVRQNLEVVNADPTLHNVRSQAKVNRPFNIGQPQQGRRTKFFTKPEKPVKFKCDVHSWMTAYLFVMEHPFFAVTDKDGVFSIDNLPPGRHTFIAWHEAFGEKRFTVEVTSQSTTTTKMEFGESP